MKCRERWVLVTLGIFLMLATALVGWYMFAIFEALRAVGRLLFVWGVVSIVCISRNI